MPTSQREHMKKILQKQGQAVDDDVIDSFVNWSQKKHTGPKADTIEDIEPELPSIEAERREREQLKAFVTTSTQV